MMNVLAIYGNPKQSGFVHGCVDYVAGRLREKGAEVDALHLADAAIRDCVGCFQCLRTGVCSLHDDLAGIIGRLRAADGLLVGASVRNGFFTALYKRFFERITYIVGFGRELRGKPLLALGAVGMATGKGPLGKMLTLDGFQTRVVGYLFFHTGIPTRITPDQVAGKLDRAADRLHAAIASHAPLSLRARLAARLDDFFIGRFMLKPNPDHVYDYIVEQWRKKGLL